ncbi:MAG: hypothetical protein EU529_00405 [Promethearchaeota archaeon]|nr:MAG: hypothetical protein EU529_00405 [Candidatus Lokiarchaeota archaeon]
MICIGTWAIHFLIVVNHFPYLYYSDSWTYYRSGRQLLIDPNRVYEEKNEFWLLNTYLPFFLMLWAISLSLLPYSISYFIWYSLNYIFAVLFVLEFNKILKLLGVKEKIHRFLFLMVISNGFLIYFQFLTNQSKFLAGTILLFILRREIQYKKEEKEKDIKYKFITYFLFGLIVSMIPYFIFLLLIFIFHDITLGELLKKENLETYGLVAIILLAQNFLFFIYPELIFDYYKVFRFFQWVQLNSVCYYLIFIDEIFIIPRLAKYLVNLILMIFMYEIIGFLIITKKLKIHEKFSYFAIAFIFLNHLAYKTIIILLPLTVLFFIPFFYQDIIGRDFIKKNKYVLIGLISILGIYLTFDTRIELLNPNYPNLFGGGIGYLIFTVLLGICLLKLHFDKDYYIVETKS